MKNTTLIILAVVLSLAGGCTKKEATEPMASPQVPSVIEKQPISTPQAQLAPSEVLARVRSDIGAKLVGPSGSSFKASDPQARQRLSAEWLRACREMRGRKLAASTHNAKTLPAEVAAFVATRNFGEMLASGKQTFVQADGLYNALYIYNLGVLTGTISADALTDEIEALSDRSPETDLDLVIYFAISDGIGEGGGGMRSDTFPLERLASLSQARNPVARLLAVEALPRSLPDGVTLPPSTEAQDTSAIDRARVAALMRFQGETDPLIIGRLIDSLGVLRLPEASQALEKIAEQQVQQKHDDLAKKAMGYLK